MTRWILLLLALATPAAASEPDGEALTWDARAVEHLLNRAGFGARPAEIAPWVLAGPEALVESLLYPESAEDPLDPFFVVVYRYDSNAAKDLPKKKRDEEKKRVRQLDQRQLRDYATWWIDRMVAGDDPLRDRMTLFWHGFFTTSSRTVREKSDELIHQHQLLRDNAVESYAELLRGIVRDPAMIHYLDNHLNKKDKPNENLARELLELFSLGEGNYTEDDVKEAARALTGFGVDGRGRFRRDGKQHDRGEKTILGHTGKLDGRDLVEILLEQEACARHVARRILAYLEGVEPDDERIEQYAALLRANDYQLRPFLRALFLDTRFYRDEVVGTRVAGPVEYVVATCRRLHRDAPSGAALFDAAALLGQRLFDPPNVKGWEGGLDWLTTARFMRRGNVAGLLVEAVDFDDLVSGDEELGVAVEAAAADETKEMERRAKRLAGELRPLRSLTSSPANIHLTERMRRAGALRDEDIVDELSSELLGVEASRRTRELLAQLLAAERAELDVRDGELLEQGVAAEEVLRRLAHQILSLPEAQLL